MTIGTVAPQETTHAAKNVHALIKALGDALHGTTKEHGEGRVRLG